MKHWWQEDQPAAAADEAEAGSEVRARSIYEGLLTEREARWTKVGEIDNQGRFTGERDWVRQVRGGWQPLEEFIADRQGDPLARLLRDRGPL
jgi:hypothetical protein